MICPDFYCCHLNTPPPPIMQRCRCLIELFCTFFNGFSNLGQVQNYRVQIGSVNICCGSEECNQRAFKNCCKNEISPKTKILDDLKSEKFCRRTSELENHGCHPLTGNFTPLTTSLGIMTIFCGIFLSTKFDLTVLVQQLCGACGSVKCS